MRRKTCNESGGKDLTLKMCALKRLDKLTHEARNAYGQIHYIFL